MQAHYQQVVSGCDSKEPSSVRAKNNKWWLSASITIDYELDVATF